MVKSIPFHRGLLGSDVRRSRLVRARALRVPCGMARRRVHRARCARAALPARVLAARSLWPRRRKMCLRSFVHWRWLLSRLHSFRVTNKYGSRFERFYASIDNEPSSKESKVTAWTSYQRDIHFLVRNCIIYIILYVGLYLLFVVVCSLDCGPHGVCAEGVCRCDEGWTGARCDQRPCDQRCQDHGQCKNGTCVCTQGWNGRHCTLRKFNHKKWICVLHTFTLVNEPNQFKSLRALILKHLWITKIEQHVLTRESIIK